MQFNQVSRETIGGHWIQRVKKVLKRVTKTIPVTDYSLNIWMCLPEPHIIQLIPHAWRLKKRRKLWTKEGRKEGGKRKKQRKIKEAWKTETRWVQPPCHAIRYNLKTFFVSLEFQIWSVFTHVASIYANLLQQKSFYIRKEFNSYRIALIIIIIIILFI